MSPVVLVVVCLCVLYVLGREVQHYERHTRILTPSRCEHVLADEVDDAEACDSWAELWNAKYAEDELERWWAIETKEPAA